MLNKTIGVTMKNSIIYIFVTISLLFLVSCGDSSSTVSPGETGISSSVDMSSSAIAVTESKILNSILHKGPYNRAEVSIQTYNVPDQNSLSRAMTSSNYLTIGNIYEIDISDSSTFSTEVSGDAVIADIEVYGESLNEFYSSDSSLSIYGNTEASFNLGLRSIAILTDSVNQTNVNVLTHLVALKVDDVVGSELGSLTKSRLDSIKKEVLRDVKLDTNIDINSISYASDPELAGKLLAVSNTFIYSSTRLNFINYEKAIAAYQNVIFPVDNESVLDFATRESYRTYAGSDKYTEITGKIPASKRHSDLTNRCEIALDTLNSYSQIRNLIGNIEISSDAKSTCIQYFDDQIGIFTNDTLGEDLFKGNGADQIWGEWFMRIGIEYPELSRQYSDDPIALMEEVYCPEQGIDDFSECHNINTYFQAFLKYTPERILDIYRLEGKIK